MPSVLLTEGAVALDAIRACAPTVKSLTLVLGVLAVNTTVLALLPDGTPAVNPVNAPL